MKPTIKPVLLSALIFPGAGHAYMKRYFSAATFIILGLLALSYILAEAISHAQIISTQILSGELPPDLNTILNAVRSRPISEHVFTANIILFITWFTAIVDTYRSSRKLSRP